MQHVDASVVTQVLSGKLSKDGFTVLAKQVNAFLFRMISILLFICAVSTSICGPLIYHVPAGPLLFYIGVFLAVGVASFALSLTKIGVHLGNHLVALIFNAVFLFSVICFFDSVGPAIFTFVFILILLSVVQNSQTMLGFTGITLILSLVYIRFFTDFNVRTLSAIVALLLFTVLYFISRYIYSINVKRLNLINRQLEELNKQINERKKAEDENLRLALYDHLTGLPNRLLFAANLHQAIEYAKNSKFGLYVMFIDLDLFKRVNDSLGHSSGDEVIKQAAERISSVFRSADSVCRVGGDEFLVTVSNIKNEQQVQDMAKRVLDKFIKPFTIDQHNIVISCSIGVAKYPQDGADVEAMIKSADLAMYKAKQEGRNRYEVYSSKLERNLIKEIRIINELQDALANNEFILHYQPQVNGTTKEIIGYEALIRWYHPTRGIIPPKDFIPVAEKSGLIIPIGEWVLRTACRQNKALQDAGLPKVPVSVNISAIQIKYNTFYNLVCDVLKETELAPEYLELEITESMIINNDEIRLELERIKEMGVRIAIDDFGTGYSTIQYLKNFPIDRIKIPIDFINGIDSNEKDESIINVILALAESLHIDVVAEGVESENQYEYLRERSCQNIQGFLFYKPMPAEKILEFFLHS